MIAESLGYVGKASAEDPGVHPCHLIFHCVHELDEEAAVEVHGAANVAQQGYPELLGLPPSSPYRDNFPAIAQIRPEGAAHVYLSAFGAGLHASAHNARQLWSQQRYDS